MSDLNTFLDVINAVGVVGILAFLLFAFYRGDLIPRVILDKILSLYEKQMTDMTEKIIKAIHDK